MRDVAIAIIILYCAVASLRKPYLGFLSWVWLSLMTPHKLSWGFIVNAPVALIAILATLCGTLIYKEKGKLFQHGIVYVQALFLLWTVITFLFAINPELSSVLLNKFSKIMLGVFLSYLLVNSREKLDGLLWVMFISIGFFGVKGGIFTLTTGGGSKVWGPQDSFISDNNTLACALLTILPIGAYLVIITGNRSIKKGLIASMALMGVSALGSNSRGALVGMLAVFLFWMRKAPGKQKAMVLLVGVLIGAVALGLMPESYWERMHTVKTYDKDASAMGRINAWWCAFNLAKDRFTGAGFDYASQYTFALYAPVPTDVHTAHSIYFQVLGDHGFIGLGIFLWMCCWTWLVLAEVIRRTNHNANLLWANQLGRMIQLSLISFFTAGAFLSLPYYDLFWQIVAVAVILRTLVLDAPANNISESPQVAEQVKKAMKYQSFVRAVK